MRPNYTTQQKISHCRQLESLLKEIPDKEYDHRYVTDCALACAARFGIGGMKMGIDGLRIRGEALMLTPQEVSDIVFGEDSYKEIFSAYPHPRKERKQPGDIPSKGEVISLLADFRKRMEKQERKSKGFFSMLKRGVSA